MHPSIEIRAEFLKTLMMEDRQEIRGIRAAIYQLVILLSTASFAITSFLLGQSQRVQNAAWMSLIIDVLIVLLLWVFFLRLRRDLYFCRQCLIARQNLIKKLGTSSEPEPFNPFVNASTEKPDVTDSELWWLPTLATLAVATKSLLVLRLFQ
jgi:hypothetical protein